MPFMTPSFVTFSPLSVQPTAFINVFRGKKFHFRSTPSAEELATRPPMSRRRSEVLDLAVAPGAQSFLVWGGAGAGFYSHVYTNLPLMCGINASPEFTVAPSIGVGYGFNSSDDPSYNNPEERTASTEALMVQAGLGLDFRISPRFAIHPAMSLLKRVSGPAGAELSWYTFGLGFKWGALPSYGQVSDP